MRDASKVIRTHEKGSMTVAELAEAVQSVWQEIRKAPAAQLQAIPVAQRPDPKVFEEDCPYEIRSEGQGLSGADVLLTIGVHLIAATAYDGLRILWDAVIYPKIRAKVDDGIGPPTDGA